MVLDNPNFVRQNLGWIALSEAVVSTQLFGEIAIPQPATGWSFLNPEITRFHAVSTSTKRPNCAGEQYIGEISDLW
jgi:hypothetical protein